MKVRYMLLLAAAAMVMAGCSAGVATYPTPPAPTTGSSSAGATATAPYAPAMPEATAMPSGTLSNAQMTAILEKSFSSYPWQIDFSSTNGSANQPTKGTIVAQSPTQVQVTMEQPIQGVTAVVNVVVISPTLYLNVSGVPDVALQALGLQAGQWTKIATDQVPLGLANLALAAANPGAMLSGLGYQNLLGQANVGETTFASMGSQQINGVMCDLYQAQVTAQGTTTTVQVAVGSSDGLVYQIQSSGPGQTTTTNMSYNPNLQVTAPIP